MKPPVPSNRRLSGFPGCGLPWSGVNLFTSDNPRNLTMERLRQLVRIWFGFSRTEVNGFLILLPLMLLIVSSEPIYSLWLSNQPKDFSRDFAQLDSAAAKWNRSLIRHADCVIEMPKRVILTKFNPNKISIEDMKRLGFDQRLSNRIANYRQKGGVFRIKSDLLKIYGVDSTFYHHLFAYIELPEVAEKKVFERTIVKEFKKTEKDKFDLNVADSVVLNNVKGIGPVLAGRILKFRNALGGFVKPSQLKEVYGLDSVVRERLLHDSFIEESYSPVKLNLNTIDEKALASHPYISKRLAKSIVSYRFQHGQFKTVEEILTLLAISPQDAEKLLPYLTVND
jgi:competence protein ComEA